MFDKKDLKKKLMEDMDHEEVEGDEMDHDSLKTEVLQELIELMSDSVASRFKKPKAAMAISVEKVMPKAEDEQEDEDDDDELKKLFK